MVCRIAVTSRSVNGVALVATPPGPRPVWAPGVMISRLLPRLWMLSVILAVVPVPSVTIAITAATPMTMPRMVSVERIALRRIARRASMIVSRSMDWLPHRRRHDGRGAVGHHASIVEADAPLGVRRHVGLVRDHRD